MYVAAQDPGAYGKLGLSDLFEMREECLREFGFSDVYRLDKQDENNLALQVRRFGSWVSGGGGGGGRTVYRLDKQNENSMALQVSRVSTLILVYI